MAQATNYFPSQNVSVWYQKETNVGDQPDDAGLKKLQTTSFTIPESSVPLEFSAARSGQFVTTATQGHHAEGTKMWTFDTTLRGTPDSVLLATEAVFESASSEATLNNNYTFPTATYVNGASSASTFEIRFEDAGADATHNNVVLQGCVGTGFTLTEDIGSEGGELVVTISWATAFMPNSGTDADDAISSPAYDTGTPKNIRSLASASCLIDSGNEMVISSWELSVQRTIERVHYKDSTSGTFEPFGYAMVGPFEVTGSITCVRNDDVNDLLAKFYDSNTVDINIAESSNFAIALDKCLLNEPTIDNGGAVLMETIPFTVVGADDISSATKMLGITIA
tara:strand:+ start:1374 stop:2387 length:1014 start_codon:yes stop_codon:yes gene_type:complete